MSECNFSSLWSLPSSPVAPHPAWPAFWQTPRPHGPAFPPERRWDYKEEDKFRNESQPWWFSFRYSPKHYITKWYMTTCKLFCKMFKICRESKAVYSNRLIIIFQLTVSDLIIGSVNDDVDQPTSMSSSICRCLAISSSLIRLSVSWVGCGGDEFCTKSLYL